MFVKNIIAHCVIIIVICYMVIIVLLHCTAKVLTALNADGRIFKLDLVFRSPI